MFVLQEGPGLGTPEAATQSPSPRSLRRATQRAPGRPGAGAGAGCPWTASCPPSSPPPPPPPPRGRPPPPAPRADSREGGAEAAPRSGGGGRSTWRSRPATGTAAGTCATCPSSAAARARRAAEPGATATSSGDRTRKQNLLLMRCGAARHK